MTKREKKKEGEEKSNKGSGAARGGAGGKECYLYGRLEGKKVRCSACAHRCTIIDGNTGVCQVRENRGGKLYSKVYDRIAALHVDPVEKKPLYHFLPGSRALSLGTVGCNFNCEFCQNHDISFPGQRKIIRGDSVPPEQLVRLALRTGSRSIAYTYTEPTIFMELVADTAKLARKKGIRNILVTNGYLTREAVDFLAPYVDAMNIDLKSFSEEFYRRNCGAKLAPVLETIRYAHEKGIWLELTTLVIEGENSSDEEFRKIADFIAGIDECIPWHISRFFPDHRMMHIPPTKLETLERARVLGKQRLKYVYIGNVGGEQDTECPKCGALLIARNYYSTETAGLADGGCAKCGTEIEGVFK